MVYEKFASRKNTLPLEPRKLQITAQASQPLNIQQPKYSVDKECLERMLQPIKLEI
jgi:hypothetical protein